MPSPFWLSTPVERDKAKYIAAVSRSEAISLNTGLIYYEVRQAVISRITRNVFF